MIDARRRRHGPRGFVLVAVIWSLGLITVMASLGIVGARYRERATADTVTQARAAAAADSGIFLGIASALLQAPNAAPAAPWSCRLPGGQHLAIATADETGKVDLNVAPVTLLTALFSNLTRDRDAGARIADDILVFRTAVGDPVGDALTRRYALDGKPEGAKHALFVTALELDQVVGVSHALFEAALPFVTVRTKRADVDFSRATPAMRRLFGIKEPGTPAPLSQGPRDVTITAEATTPDGARFIREALVSIGGMGGDPPYTIHEWRHADRAVPSPDGAAASGAACDKTCFSGMSPS